MWKGDLSALKKYPLGYEFFQKRKIIPTATSFSTFTPHKVSVFTPPYFGIFVYRYAPAPATYNSCFLWLRFLKFSLYQNSSFCLWPPGQHQKACHLVLQSVLSFCWLSLHFWWTHPLSFIKASWLQLTLFQKLVESSIFDFLLFLRFSWLYYNITFLALQEFSDIFWKKFFAPLLPITIRLWAEFC